MGEFIINNPWLFNLWLFLCLVWWFLCQICAFLSEEELPLGSEDKEIRFTVFYSIFNLVFCSIIYFTGHFAMNFLKSWRILEGLIVLIVGVILYYVIHRLYDWKYDDMMYKIKSGDGIIRMSETVAIQTKTKEEFMQVVEKFLLQGVVWSSDCKLIQEDKWDKYREKTCVMKELYNGSYILKCGLEETLKDRRGAFILSSQEFLAISNEASVIHL